MEFMVTNLGSGMAVCYVLLLALVHIMMAFAVYFEAEKFTKRKGELVFFNSVLWFVVTLVAGLMAAALFWACHLSSLSQAQNNNLANS